jgi:glycosyltransferase involved in cell wall biosynthesis
VEYNREQRVQLPHNLANYLDNLLHSILNEIIFHNFHKEIEIIIGDNNSTDDTKSVVSNHINKIASVDG